MVMLPNLVESPFHRIQIDLSVPFDRLSDSELESLSEQCAGLPGEESGPIDERELFEILGAKRFRGSVQHDFDVEWEVVRCSLSLELDPTASGETGDSKRPRFTPESVPDYLSDFEDKVSDLAVSAYFTIDRAIVPKHSVVASMMGLRTVAGEEQFLLTGAQFAVRAFPGDTVSWYLTPGEDGRQISGELVRGTTETIHEQVLIDAIYILQARFNRIVLAQSDLKVHAAS